MSTAVKTARKVWAEAELEALPEKGCAREVVNGERVMSPKNNCDHADIRAGLPAALRTLAETNHPGAVGNSSTGHGMKNLNCRAPTRRRRLNPAGELGGENLRPGFRSPVADLFKE